ncbi:hypothetical protein MHYP_G00069000 [Metynnis hypsauchen]
MCSSGSSSSCTWDMMRRDWKLICLTGWTKPALVTQHGSITMTRIPPWAPDTPVITDTGQTSTTTTINFPSPSKTTWFQVLNVKGWVRVLPYVKAVSHSVPIPSPLQMAALQVSDLSYFFSCMLFPENELQHIIPHCRNLIHHSVCIKHNLKPSTLMYTM